MRNNYLAVIYKDLYQSDYVSNKAETIRKIHQDIRKITEVYKAKYDFTSTKLEKYVRNLSDLTVKKSRQWIPVAIGVASLLLFADEIIKFWQKQQVFTNTNKIINERVRQQETRDKKDAIESFIKVCRSKKEIFFLSSDHDDCAEDHKAYQRKLYIDGAWRKDITFYHNVKAIRQFINERNIKTFQWVTHKPVWLITRPNCRHYFISLTWGEVKNHTINELVNKYNTHSSVGERKYQPIWHPANQEWYTRENVEAIIDKYRERLTYHMSLYKQVKNDELKKLINKDKLLLKKWEKLLTEL